MNRLKKSLPILLVVAFSIVAMAVVGARVTTADTPDSGVHVLLVGHGIPANDYPKDRLREFFQMSAKHHTGQGNKSEHGHSHDNDWNGKFVPGLARLKMTLINTVPRQLPSI